MDLQSYKDILTKTEFQKENIKKLAELIREDKPERVLLGLVGLRTLLSRVYNPFVTEILDEDVIPPLKHIAENFQEQLLQFEALWCITNIASDSDECVEKLYAAGILDVLVKYLGSFEPQPDGTKLYTNTHHCDNIDQAIWCIGNIAATSEFYSEQLNSKFETVGLTSFCDKFTNINVFSNPYQRSPNLFVKMNN